VASPSLALVGCKDCRVVSFTNLRGFYHHLTYWCPYRDRYLPPMTSVLANALVRKQETFVQSVKRQARARRGSS
jgi:hypothetical protein